MTFRVLVTARSFANAQGAHQDYLRDHHCVVDLKAGAAPLSADALSALISGYDGVILGLDHCDAQVIAAADRLRVISRYGVGVDAVDLKAAAAKGIAVTNTPGANQNGVAELTIGLLFALARHLPSITTAARQNGWLRTTGWELSGKVLGLVGFGGIGRDVAAKALGLGMRVLAFDKYWKQDVAGVTRVELADLLAGADVVSLHAALTPETKHLINPVTLAQMKHGAVLLNTARGELADEAALLAALQTGQLRGAAADVLEADPPTGHPLLAQENFLYTPHIGATTRESVARMAIMASRNCVAVLRGDPCEYIVNEIVK